MEVNIKKIVFFVGPSWAPWDPESVKISGNGGSEIALIALSSRFAKQGHQVIVYGTPVKEGIYDGVEYYHYDNFTNIRCHILISSRAPYVLDPEKNVIADLSFFWVHDLHYSNDVTPERMAHFDKIVCLSQWHRDYFINYYKFIDLNKVIIINNGIDVENYSDTSIVRDPHKAFYSSAPNRGLDVACTVWHKIRERVPDAELHVYYGFENVEKMLAQFNDEAGKKQLEITKNLLRDTEGVVYHGRVSPSVLARGQLSSGVWAYPTGWYECHSITALEAKAAGCRIVTTALGSLVESIGEHGVLINGDYRTPEYQQQFVDRVVEAMLKEDNQDRIDVQKYAFDNFNWDNRVKQWFELFEKLSVEFSPKAYSYRLYDTLVQLRDIDKTVIKVDFLFDELSMAETDVGKLEAVKNQLDVIKAELDEQYKNINKANDFLNTVKLLK
jgi:glycosyltransferase involved in cell wall biosynthesis